MNHERIFKVVLGPHVTEKSTVISEGAGQVVFKVATDANKSEIKAAVETLFKVKVEGVRTVKVKGKTRRTRHVEGSSSDGNNAYIHLAASQEIDFTGSTSMSDAMAEINH